MSRILSIIIAVAAVAFTAGCQSTTPPPIVEITLDPPTPQNAVKVAPHEAITTTRWSSANHFDVHVVTAPSGKLKLSDNAFTIEEIDVSVNGGGSWFRDRFGLRLAVRGEWSSSGKQPTYFSAEKFVTYPNGVEFKAADADARSWLQGQILGLWHDVQEKIAAAR